MGYDRADVDLETACHGRAAAVVRCPLFIGWRVSGLGDGQAQQKDVHVGMSIERSVGHDFVHDGVRADHAAPTLVAASRAQDVGKDRGDPGPMPRVENRSFQKQCGRVDTAGRPCAAVQRTDGAERRVHHDPFRRRVPLGTAHCITDGYRRQQIMDGFRRNPLAGAATAHGQESKAYLRCPDEHRGQVTSRQAAAPEPQRLGSRPRQRQPPGRGQQQIPHPAGRIEVRRFVSGLRAERERGSPSQFGAGEKRALLPQFRRRNGFSQFAGRSAVQTAVAPCFPLRS